MYTPKYNYEKAISELIEKGFSLPTYITSLSGYYFPSGTSQNCIKHTFWITNQNKLTEGFDNSIFSKVYHPLKITTFRIPNSAMKQWVSLYFWLKAILMGLPITSPIFANKRYLHIFVEVNMNDFYYFEEIHNKLLEASKNVETGSSLLRRLHYDSNTSTYLKTLMYYNKDEFTKFINDFKKFIFDSPNTTHYLHIF